MADLSRFVEAQTTVHDTALAELKPLIENEHVAQLVRDGVFNAEHAGPDTPRHHAPDRPLTAVPTGTRAIPNTPITRRNH